MSVDNNQRRSVAIVAVGDELLAGRTQDSNSSWLARFAFRHGWHCVSMQQVGDDPKAMRRALDSAVATAELVLVTGGLGPTIDDRTRQVLAEWAAVPLVEDAAAWQQINDFWASRVTDQPMPACNRQQALKPAGAELLANARGTAPAILMTHGSGTIAAMPGVPYEMYGLAESVFARLADEEVAPPSCHSYFAGLGESSLQELLGDLSHDADDCRVGVYCHDGGHLEVVTVGSGATARDALVRERCAQYVLPANGLAASLVEVAQAAGVTIAVAESCTGGRIARALTAVPGASAVLTEALVTYTAAAKSSRLGVPPEVIAAHDVVSEAVVTAMALGVQPGQPSQPNQSNTATSYQDCLSIATTGYAGPTGGTERDPVGTVYVAVNFRGETQHVRLQTGGERQRIVQRASAKALLLAWQSLTAAVKV